MLDDAICMRPHYLGISEKSQVTGLIDTEPLSEFLHDWGQVDYQFAPGLDKPFGHQEDVVFYKTHPRYGLPENENFRAEYDELTQQFVWKRAAALRCPEPLRALNRLKSSMVTSGTRPFVLKTQVADLRLRVGNGFIKNLREFHAQYGITTIYLTRKDRLAWIISMLLSEASGQFIPGESQQKAIEYFKANKLKWTTEQIARLQLLWNSHKEVQVAFPGISVDETTLCELFLQLRMLTYDERLVVERTYQNSRREFSSTFYVDMVENMDGLKAIADTF
jgi:hypothetical protein